MNVRHLRPIVVTLLLVFAPGCTPIETPAAQPSTPPAATDSLVFDTWVPGPCSPNGQPQGQCPPGDLFRVRLVPVAEGLTSPRHMAFTPNGELLITELAEPPGAPAAGNQAIQGREGRIRVVRGGVLAMEPLAGWPAPSIEAGALQSVIVHPQFSVNHFVYLYYIKKREEMSSRALARAS
jgi:glucose/arabinose dehydrogenase